ncbi:MAG: nicotinamide-nucleotide adenylyltransferase [Methanomassiliicoccaceae archaeon]|jgi:nicotinamide-nucleotide adenylyltransferase|nr:nicotinamide-nucleotide adenylyltransferase [Methanomassiliicoccaceae archaeon]
MGKARHERDSLIIGRFQPFHKGHMEVIREISKDSDTLTIGIGSAQYSHTVNNPFTAGERYRMISNTLKDEGITNAYIVPIEDLNRYSVWVSHVVSMSPPFSVVYSNNSLTRRLFIEAGYKIKDSPLYNRPEYSGTEVRRRMLCDGDWRALVPKAVADVIDDIDGIGRIKGLNDDI